MSDSRRDDEFEAYLRKRRRTGRGLAPVEHLEPPEELDRLIIGNARRAIAPPAHVSHFRAPQWSVSLGLAATILISLSVLLDVGMRGAVQQDAARGQAAAVTDAAPAAAEPAQVNIAPWPPAPLAADATRPADPEEARSRAEHELANRRLRRIMGQNGAPEMETVTIIGQRVAMQQTLPGYSRN